MTRDATDRLGRWIAAIAMAYLTMRIVPALLQWP